MIQYIFKLYMKQTLILLLLFISSTLLGLNNKTFIYRTKSSINKNNKKKNNKKKKIIKKSILDIINKKYYQTSQDDSEAFISIYKKQTEELLFYMRTDKNWVFIDKGLDFSEKKSDFLKELINTYNKSAEEKNAVDYDSLPFNQEVKFKYMESRDLVKNIQDTSYATARFKYKIHIQVAYNHMFNFLKKFLGILSQDNFADIQGIKFYNIFEKTKEEFTDDVINQEGKNLPSIVLYPYLLPGTKEQNNIILFNLISAIQDSISSLHIAKIMITDKHNTPVAPRYNKSIIPGFLYIAGGNGDDKNYIKKHNECENQKIYTKDLVFFKEFEYDL